MRAARSASWATWTWTSLTMETMASRPEIMSAERIRAGKHLSSRLPAAASALMVHTGVADIVLRVAAHGCHG